MARALTDLYIRLYAAAALDDVLAAVAEWRPDVVVRESAEFASLVAAERLGVPHARVGLGLTTQLEARMFPLAGPALDELGARVLAPPGLGGRAAGAPCLTMAPPSLDAGGPGEAERVHRFRDAGAETEVPAPGGWGDPAAPLVLVSFGTEVPSHTRPYFPGLYRAAVEALEATGARVLVAVGTARDPADLGPVPASVRVERWVAQAAVMPHAAAMVGHGGAGSTLGALAAGVPMALVPLFADQPFNARLVAGIGAGIALDDGLAAPSRLEAAVLELVHDGRYRDRAAAVADEIAALPPVDAAPDTLAALAPRS